MIYVKTVRRVIYFHCPSCIEDSTLKMIREPVDAKDAEKNWRRNKIKINSACIGVSVVGLKPTKDGLIITKCSNKIKVSLENQLGDN